MMFKMLREFFWPTVQPYVQPSLDAAEQTLLHSAGLAPAGADEQMMAGGSARISAATHPDMLSPALAQALEGTTSAAAPGTWQQHVASSQGAAGRGR